MRNFVVFVAVTAALALAACGGSSAGTGADAGVPPTPPDLESGTWTVEQASHTDGTISHDGTLAFLDNGQAWLAWSEPDPIHYSNQAIYAATYANGTWTLDTPLTGNEVQYGFPSMQAHGSELHVAFSGYADGDNDIYYMHHAAAGWSARLDLTSLSETSGKRTDIMPSLAVAPNGEVAIAYVSEPIDSTGASTGPHVIRVVRVVNGALAGEPETVITATTGECLKASAVFDSHGKLHVVADCGLLFDEDIVYATDASGSWQQQTIPGTDGRDDVSPQIALGKDDALYVVWTGNSACGSSVCGDVYDVKVSGGVIGPIGNLTNSASVSENAPIIGIDRFGRVAVAWNQANAQNFIDIYFVWSADGVSYSAPKNLTPNTDDRDDWNASSIVFEPATNLPSVVFTTVFANTDPLNSEIMRAVYKAP